MKNKTPRNHLINTYKVTEMTTDDINSVVTNNKNASALCYMFRQNEAIFAISTTDNYRNMCLENQALKTANNTDEFSSDLAMYALQNIMKAFGDDTLLLKFRLDDFRQARDLRELPKYDPQARDLMGEKWKLLMVLAKAR